MAERGAERFNLDPVRPAQADEPQRRRQLFGVLQLGRFAELHGCARVHQRIKVQGTKLRKSENSKRCPLRLLRRSPFIRPRKILRLTSSMRSSCARSVGGKSWAAASAVVMVS